MEIIEEMMDHYKVYLEDRDSEIAMISLSLDHKGVCEYVGENYFDIDFAKFPLSDFKKLIDCTAKEVAEEEFNVDPTDLRVTRLKYVVED